MAGVLFLLTLVLTAVAGLVVAQREAQGIADLAALAAASTVGDGADGCAAARHIAAQSGAGVRACAVEGWTVLLEVEVAGPRWAGRLVRVGAEARAGPVD